MEGKLIIISAPSGAGKTTIVNFLLNRGLGLEFSISATTRPPRGTEKNGKEYYFLSTEDFHKNIINKEFAEWQEVYKGYMYGTLKSEIERIWADNKHVIFDVDVKGGINLKDAFRNRAVSVFIMPPSLKELKKRLCKRATDDRSVIKVRIEKAVKEMEMAHYFDYIVINKNLEQAQNEVLRIVKGFISNQVGTNETQA
jgi:guanylate kinase